MSKKNVVIELPFVFPTPNDRSGRWKSKKLVAKAERYIFDWMMKNGRPDGKNYELKIVRQSRVAADKDNVAASSKKLQDILHRYAIIPDDKAAAEGGEVEFEYVGMKGATKTFLYISWEQ